jgi:hypothetical protein
MVRLSFTVLCLALFLFSTSAISQYTVVVDPSRPSLVNVTLTVPASDGKPRKLFLRGVQWGLKPQVVNPRCRSGPLKRSAPGEWVLPASCARIDWTVPFKTPAPGTVDVSKQASLFFRSPGWWLLSEPTSLLRLKGDPQASSLQLQGVKASVRQVGATSVRKGVWRVPPTNNAPEFYAFGNIAHTTETVGTFTVQYVADNSTLVSSLGLPSLHEVALNYLVNVLPPPPNIAERDRNLLVVWVGVDERHGQAGGAAGSRSFLANYIVGSKRNADVNAARTMMVLAHEQFHQLADLVRGERPPLPLWLGESLGCYYGLKALEHSALPTSAKHQVRRRFVDPTRRVLAGLLELDRRHAGGDALAYPLFYEQGSTFWAELDQSLSEATSGKRTLDEFIVPLLESDLPSDGKLPQTFLASLRSAGGPKIDALLDKYVGR